MGYFYIENIKYKKMKKQILQFTFLSVALSIIYFTNVSYSSGPPTTAVTGGCTCHGPASSNTVVAVSFNGGNLYYTNGQTYPITISVVSTTAKPAAGFALSTNVGTFGAAPLGTQKIGNVWMHSSPKTTSGVSPTFATWTINWTAPAIGAVPLQIFATGNAVNGGGSGGDEWAFAPSLNVALPVNFVKFSAIKFNDNNILNWSVSNEENLKEYQIERSENGNDFNIIGVVNAQNYTKYQFIDNEKINSYDVYYRIKAVDIDGKLMLSEVRFIQTQQTDLNIKIYPTIISANENLNIINLKKVSKILIYSSSGQLIKTEDVSTSTQNINLNSFSKGMYFVFINSNNSTSLIDKIIVQ